MELYINLVEKQIDYAYALLTDILTHSKTDDTAVAKPKSDVQIERLQFELAEFIRENQRLRQVMSERHPESYQASLSTLLECFENINKLF